MERRKRNYKKEEPEWIPKTALGKQVKAGEITSIDQILNSGKKILEPQIISALLPDFKDEVLKIKSTQRMTPCGRKMQMQAVVALGNKRGYVAVGLGKGPDTRMAITEAIANAKRNIVRVPLGCGSWECSCGQAHSIIHQATGQNSSTQILIKPAPRGVGIVAGETAKKVLALAGVNDVWTFAKGRTRNVLNTVLATLDALDSLNSTKGNLLEKAVPLEEETLPKEQEENQEAPEKKDESTTPEPKKA
ncbi:MAG: 30S ribosomal protein S5 [Candidatus Micrarchaeia archaeon]